MKSTKPAPAAVEPVKVSRTEPAKPAAVEPVKVSRTEPAKPAAVEPVKVPDIKSLCAKALSFQLGSRVTQDILKVYTDLQDLTKEAGKALEMLEAQLLAAAVAKSDVEAGPLHILREEVSRRSVGWKDIACENMQKLCEIQKIPYAKSAYAERVLSECVPTVSIRLRVVTLADS